MDSQQSRPAAPLPRLDDAPLRILVVDGDERDRLEVRRCLQLSGLPAVIDEAGSAAETLERLGPAVYDCVLLEASIPGVNGLSLLLQGIRDTAIEMPAVMFTGRGNEEVAVALMNAGVAEYLPKASLTPERLASSLRHAMELSRAVTAERRAEHEHHVQESRFRTLANAIPQLAWMADTSGAIHWYNERWYDFTGMRFEEMQGWGWQKVHHPDHVQRVTECIQRSFDTGEPWEDTFPLRGRDGVYRWFLSRAVPLRDDSGNIVGWLGTNTDITERIQQTQRQRTLAETAIRINSSLTVAEPVQTILQMVSDAVAEIIGAHMVTIAMTGDHGWAKVMQAVSLSDKYAAWRTYDERPNGSGIYAEVCRTNRPMRLTRAELVAHPLFRGFGDAAARHPPLRGWLCVPLIGRDGRNLGALHVSDKFVGDFTADDEAVALQLATIAAAAMENCAAYGEVRDAGRRKDEFLAVLAHELRNPLAPVLTAAGMLRMDHPNDARVQHISDVLERQGKQMMRLIDDLLDASRIGRGKLVLVKQVVDLATVVDRALDAIQSAIDERRHELSLSLPSEPLRVEVDPARLNQVLCNLLSNAVKYTEPGGHIWVTAVKDQSDVVIRVRDTGIGMSPEFVVHAFEMFHQAAPEKPDARGGLGIGLALVRSLVEMHGGTVSAHSEGLQKGSEFTVRLPCTGQSCADR